MPHLGSDPRRPLCPLTVLLKRSHTPTHTLVVESSVSARERRAEDLLTSDKYHFTFGPDNREL